MRVDWKLVKQTNLGDLMGLPKRKLHPSYIHPRTGEDFWNILKPNSNTFSKNSSICISLCRNLSLRSFRLVAGWRLAQRLRGFGLTLFESLKDFGRLLSSLSLNNTGCLRTSLLLPNKALYYISSDLLGAENHCESVRVAPMDAKTTFGLWDQSTIFRAV